MSAANAVLRVLNSLPQKEVCISNDELAKRIGKCSRTANRALAQLVKAELIRVEYVRTTGPGEVGRIIHVSKKTDETEQQ